MSMDSVFVHKIWNEVEISKMVSGGVPFAMLSDAGGRVGSLYDVYDIDAGVDTRGDSSSIQTASFRAMRCSPRRLAAMSWRPFGRSRHSSS